MNLAAFLILTLYKTFLYLVGFLTGITLALWLKTRL